MGKDTKDYCLETRKPNSEFLSHVAHERKRCMYKQKEREKGASTDSMPPIKKSFTCIYNL